MSGTKRYLVIFLVLALLAAALAGCSPQTQTAAPAPESKNGVIRIAGQFGLVYAPLMAAQERQIFEKYGLSVEWKEYGSGGAVREALVSGDLDVGFMGIPPFLIGWDKGVPAKVAIGYVCAPCALVTYLPEIKTLRDFKPEHKIALPSPGSIQHILLSMEAEKRLGDPKALDNQLVALPHPDAAAALLVQKDIAAHFATPPYLFQELSQPGYHVVLSDHTAFGNDYSFNVGLVTERYHDANPAGYAAFVMAINEAMTWINENTAEAAELLAPKFNLDAATTLSYLTWEGMNYTTTPYGLMGFAEFMQQAGYIQKVPAALSDLAWENVLATVGVRRGEPSALETLQYRD